MTTTRTVSYYYDATPEAVAERLQDPKVLQRRCESQGEKSVEVSVAAADGHVEVVVARERELDVPSFAKLVIDPRTRITERQRWFRSDASFRVEYSIELGSPVGRVVGRSVFAPEGSGCRYETSFDVTANVPLIGRKVEAVLADRIEASIRAATALTL